MIAGISLFNELTGGAKVSEFFTLLQISCVKWGISFELFYYGLSLSGRLFIFIFIKSVSCHIFYSACYVVV